MAMRATQISLARLSEGIGLLRDAIEDKAQEDRIPKHVEMLINLVELRTRNDTENEDYVTLVSEVTACEINLLDAEAHGGIGEIESASLALKAALDHKSEG